MHVCLQMVMVQTPQFDWTQFSLPRPKPFVVCSVMSCKWVCTFVTNTYFLPSLLCVLGVSLRRQVRDSTAEVLEGVTQLLEVILSSPLQGYMLQKNTRHNKTLLYYCHVMIKIL